MRDRAQEMGVGRDLNPFVRFHVRLENGRVWYDKIDIIRTIGDIRDGFVIIEKTIIKTYNYLIDRWVIIETRTREIRKRNKNATKKYYCLFIILDNEDDMIRDHLN